MSLRDEYGGFSVLGVVAAGVLIIAGHASGMIKPRADPNATEPASAQTATASSKTCNDRGLYPKCWDGVEPDRYPTTADPVEGKAQFDCSARSALFRVQYYRTIPNSNDPEKPHVLLPDTVDDFVTPGTAVAAGGESWVIEVDFAKWTYRIRDASETEWRSNRNTATDVFEVESGTKDFVCFDHGILPKPPEEWMGRSYFCSMGIDLRTLRFEALDDLVPAGRHNDFAADIEKVVAKRSVGECIRTDLQTAGK